MEIFRANIYDENATAKMERLSRTLNEKTYFDFRVDYGTIPSGYSYTISANNCNESCRQDALNMAIGCLVEM